METRHRGATPRAEEWCSIEWPAGDQEVLAFHGGINLRLSATTDSAKVPMCTEARISHAFVSSIPAECGVHLIGVLRRTSRHV
jgi:hypothetical protein